jgi:hypothetical protein
MGREDEFRLNAEQAEKSAITARTEHERQAYLKIAEGWRDLLKQAEDRAKLNGE